MIRIMNYTIKRVCRGEFRSPAGIRNRITGARNAPLQFLAIHIIPNYALK